MSTQIDPLRRTVDEIGWSRRKTCDAGPDFGAADDDGAHDYDACDAPARSVPPAPLILRVGTTEWFRWEGAWHRVGTLHDAARRAYLAEQVIRERREKHGV